MTPKQLQELEAHLVASLAGTVKTVVNGKIDKIDAKLSAHIEEHRADTLELKGILELKRGAKVLGEIGKWLGSLAVFGYIIKWYFLR